MFKLNLLKHFRFFFVQFIGARDEFKTVRNIIYAHKNKFSSSDKCCFIR